MITLATGPNATWRAANQEAAFSAVSNYRRLPSDASSVCRSGGCTRVTAQLRAHAMSTFWRSSSFVLRPSSDSCSSWHRLRRSLHGSTCMFHCTLHAEKWSSETSPGRSCCRALLQQEHEQHHSHVLQPGRRTSRSAAGERSRASLHQEPRCALPPQHSAGHRQHRSGC